MQELSYRVCGVTLDVLLARLVFKYGLIVAKAVEASLSSISANSTLSDPSKWYCGISGMQNYVINTETA